jgi:hypothetical protein
MSIIIVGAGPNRGAAIARRCGREVLPDELSGRGVHVAHTAIGGRIEPGGDHEPYDVAEVL